MIHPTAIVSLQAELDGSVEVGAYSVIGDQVRIAAGTSIGHHVVITGPCDIGPNNRIYSFAAIGGDPQDKKYKGETSRLVIGTGNTFREFCTLNRGTAADRGVTEIGDDNWVMAYVHIAHDCRVGSHTVLANNTTLAGHVEVGDYVILGGFTKIHQFCRIGCYAFTAMDVGISRDVPPYVTVAGHLAEPRGINTLGLQRNGFSEEQIRNVRDAYRLIYRMDLRLEEALGELRKQMEHKPELRVLCEFLSHSDRSIVR